TRLDITTYRYCSLPTATAPTGDPDGSLSVCGTNSHRPLSNARRVQRRTRFYDPDLLVRTDARGSRVFAHLDGGRRYDRCRRSRRKSAWFLSCSASARTP